MPIFEYVGERPDGREAKGTLDAPDKKAARVKVEEMGLKIKSVVVEGEFTWAEIMDRNNRRVTGKDLFLFTKYFGVLLKAGIPVVKCLQILVSQTVNIRLKKCLHKIMDDIEGGLSMFEAFGKHPKYFNNMYVNLIKTGEESGLLYHIFEKLTDFMQKAQALKAKVKGAMVYPITVAFVGMSVAGFLLVFIVPRFGKIFASFGGDLPLMTKIMLQLSQIMKDYCVVGIIGAVVGGFLFKKFLGTKAGKKSWDIVILKVPMIGGLTKKYATVQFCSNLSILLKSGVNITRSLQVCIGAVENQVIADQVEGAATRIEGGISVSDAFGMIDVLPAMAKQMIAVGDETGNLEDMLQNVSEFYEDEVDSLVDAVTSMIEPIFILFLGVVVGGMVVAMFMPMFKMARVLSGDH
ncbi:MAG: type II secretion system F family protein [bacterium]|jgi:type IV pilus assembly protein PilC|nr:type II secretion system F family protein [bacterium]